MRNFKILPADRQGDKIILSRHREIHHLVHVLRYRVGEEVSLLDGEGKRYQAEISSISDKTAEFKILSVTSSSPPLAITLAQAAVKGNAMDTIVEKATEFGVRELIPLKTARTSVDVERLVKNRQARWRRIIEAACKQSAQARVMAIRPYQNLEDLLKEVDKFSSALFLSLDPSSLNLIKALQNGKVRGSTLLMVGPEGGWTKEEEKSAEQAGCICVHLASTTLRSETAVIAALAVLTTYASKGSF